ncbi:copper-binding protein [Pandoraea sp. XJJ-1]|uniref:copper-binding protein n=1 Tax=unclassified Pandoraea TaxID=2624094 RepID=UPI00034B1134|nr:MULTISPECIES: copper-binding protein [unclassified Pandoraea]WAL85013.1 copper-binding protein [Pandoraea sp. XJJ-1]
MFKTISAMLTCVALGASLPAMAAGAADMKPMSGMSQMGGMKADKSAAVTATGTGVVKAVDKQGGSVTLAHGPINALGWGPMTMGFKVADAKLLNGVSVGQKVDFTLVSKDDVQTVTAIRAAK